MKRLAILVFVLSAGAVGWVAAELDGRRNAEAYQQKSFSGSVSVGRTQVGFSMPAGYTVKGKPGSPRVFPDTRETRFVPDTLALTVSTASYNDTTTTVALLTRQTIPIEIRLNVLPDIQ